MTWAQHRLATNPEWDGICVRCGADYRTNALAGIRNGCLSCLAQFNGEPIFDDDPEDVAEAKREAANRKRPRGRPAIPTTDHRHVLLTVRLTKAEHQRLASTSLARAVPVSDLVREAIRHLIDP